METAWTSHVDDDGDERTEVHELSLSVLVVEVSKQVNHKLWTGTIMVKESYDVIGKQIYDADLEHCKVMIMVKAMSLLQKEAESLMETMIAMGHKPTNIATT